MNVWLLKRMDQRGGYLARPGSRLSYTSNLRYAQRFSTQEAAERERCEDNEAPVRLEDIYGS